MEALKILRTQRPFVDVWPVFNAKVFPIRNAGKISVNQIDAVHGPLQTSTADARMLNRSFWECF